jgi:hypothetical protein
VKGFTATDLLTTCGKHEERLGFVTKEVEGNAHMFVQRLNALLLLFGKERTLSSGFRDKASNKAAGGAAFSWHILGLAADIEDKDRELAKFILSDSAHLRKCGLYAEHPDKTPTWVHVQSEPPRSGRRIFQP